MSGDCLLGGQVLFVLLFYSRWAVIKRAKNEEGSSSINMMLLEGLQKRRKKHQQENTLACHDNRYILSRTIITNKRRVYL